MSRLTALLLAAIVALLTVTGFAMNAALSMPQVAVVALPMTPQQAAAGTGLRTVTPGLPITVYAQGSSSAGKCTVGALWVDQYGKRAWLTAGHCAKGKAEVYDDRGASPRLLGRFNDDTVDEVDASLVRPAYGVKLVPALSLRSAKDGQEYHVDVYAYGGVHIGDHVCAMGRTTGLTCGWEITDLDARHTLDNGAVIEAVQAQGRGDVCVSPGDSGGPVVRMDTKGARIVGIITASARKDAFAMILPASCTVLFTSVRTIAAALGGHPLTTRD